MKSPYFHLIIWLLICGAALAGYGFWYTVVTDESGAVAALQSQIQEKATESVRITAARTALADISGDESLVQSYFVPESGVVPFIDSIEGIASAQKADMKILSVSTSGTAKQSNLALLLTISIDGTFDAMMRTIGAIEYAPYDLSVTNLSIAKDATNLWHADLELTIGSSAAGQATSTPTLVPAQATSSKPLP